MSFATWKKEFYPVKPSKRMTTIQAIEHSIQKWEGLRKENLDKHDVRLDYSMRNVVGEGREHLDIDTKSCALCVKFMREDTYDDKGIYIGEPCQNCPLYISRGGYPCDRVTEKERERAMDKGLFSYDQHPFGQLCEHANPKPMIAALKKTLKMVQKQEQV